MKISYTKNNVSSLIGQYSEPSVLSGLYTYFNHSIHLLEEDYGMYYYKFKAKENHILEASYSASYIKLVFCLSGHAVNDFNSQFAYSFQDNSSLLYQIKNGSHLSKIYSDKEIEIVHIHIPLTVLEKYLTDAEISRQISSGKKVIRPLTFHNRQIVYQLHNTSYNSSLQKLFIEKLMLEHLFFFLNDNQVLLKTNSITPNKIEEAKYLLDCSVDFITIAQLAKKMGMNEFSLKTEFKEAFNTSIYQYQKDKRFEQAYSLIHETNMKIEEIMEYCGYVSLGSFSNSFYKKFGIRPSSLRNF